MQSCFKKKKMLDTDALCSHLYVESAKPEPKENLKSMWFWQMIPWLTLFAATFAYQMYKAKNTLFKKQV